MAAGALQGSAVARPFKIPTNLHQHQWQNTTKLKNNKVGRGEHFKNDILLESDSRNTMENVINSTELIATHQKVLLITSASHMKRAKFCCNKTQLKCDYLSADNTFYDKNL